MLAEFTLVVALAVQPMAHPKFADDYAQCGYYHWSLVKSSRKNGDLEQLHRHLAQLSKLARSLAMEMRISLDGAHAIIRRTGDAIADYTGDDIPAVANAGRVCSRLERDLFGAHDRAG